MPLTDAVLYIHGTGTTAFGALSVASGVYGDSVCRAGSAYSNLELDLGAPGSASSWPYVSQFPSYTEQGYSFPPETLGTPGMEIGLHVVVGSSFNSATSINIQACSSSSSSATYTYAIASRSLTLAQLQATGAHYFIPVNGNQMLEFNRAYFSLTGSSPTAGTLLCWYGPRTGGEM